VWLREIAIGQQFYQMPQSRTISVLEMNGNSFTGEGVHTLAGFIHLCPCVKHLHTSDSSITSDDLLWLLNRLTQLKSSSSNLCSKLQVWYLSNNQLDDAGVSALIDHLPSLFPYLAYYGTSLDDNPVSSEMKKRLEEELRRPSRGRLLFILLRNFWLVVKQSH
jgi:hypothetical protein